MERRAFGQTGMEVSVLGFGGSEIGFMGADFADVEALLNAALDEGLNVIDTAECYMDSEEKIGRAVGHRRDEFWLFSKVGHRFMGGPELDDWSVELMRASVENTLRKLRTDRVDLLQLHSCGKEVLEREETRRFIEDVRAEGQARFIGYSGDGQDAVFALGMGVFDALQTSVNIADQESVDLLLPIAREQGIGVVAKRPVANVAWLNWPEAPARPYARTYFDRLRELDYPFLQKSEQAFETALRFTLSQSVNTMIVGTTRPGRWQANAKVVAMGRLPDADLEAIRTRWSTVQKDDWVGQT